MYNDYPTIYKSTTTGIFDFINIFVVISFILLIILTIVSLSKVFKKANRNSISAFIPIYNIYTLIEICNLPKIYILLFLIPVINIIPLITTSFKLASLFKKSNLFGFGLVILPFIYYPILGFGRSEYIGLNLVALEKKGTVEKILEVDSNKVKEIEKEINDKYDINNKNINISIGGGKYQKEYNDSLLKVDSNNEIKNELEEDVKEKENVDLLKSKTVSTKIFNDNVIKPKDETSRFLNQVDDINNNTTENNTNTETYIVCPNCRTKLNSNIDVCYICGLRLK